METRIELHSHDCSCRGGSWALLGKSAASPCSGPDAEKAEKRVVTLGEWKAMSKPGSLEAYCEAEKRAASGERRHFQRFEVEMDVRIARVGTWQNPTSQKEETKAEIIATGGALVRSRMAVEKGETVLFSIGNDYDTHAEVMYVSSGQGPGLDGVQRLGLKFLDAPLPDVLIPSDARPLPEPAGSE